MLEDLGEFLGGTIIFLYGLTILNFFVKWVNKKFRAQLKKNDFVFKVFSAFMKVIVKYHKAFGLLTIGALLSHFVVQFFTYGLSLTGAAAASVLILQVVLGVYGYLKKKRGGIWLKLHRGVAVLLMIAIYIHVE
jgi:hypothetical protein